MSLNGRICKFYWGEFDFRAGKKQARKECRCGCTGWGAVSETMCTALCSLRLSLPKAFLEHLAVQNVKLVANNYYFSWTQKSIFLHARWFAKKACHSPPMSAQGGCLFHLEHSLPCDSRLGHVFTWVKETVVTLQCSAILSVLCAVLFLLWDPV